MCVCECGCGGPLVSQAQLTQVDSSHVTVLGTSEATRLYKVLTNARAVYHMHTQSSLTPAELNAQRELSQIARDSAGTSVDGEAGPSTSMPPPSSTRCVCE